MDNFTYSNPVKMLFGRGQIDKTAEEILPYGKKVLLVYGEGSIKKNGIYDNVTGQLKKAGIAFEELSGVHPNPRVSLVRKGAEICRDNGLDFILGVGGGSTCDTAKAIGMAAVVDYDIWNAYEDFHNLMHGNQGSFTHIPQSTIPVGIIMTKPGTGSDFDYTSVLSNHETKEKLMVINKVMYPKFSIIDPEAAFSLPDDQRRYGVADIMTHIMEQYFTTTKDVAILDLYKESNLKRVVECGRRVMANKDDYEAFAELFYIASWACSDQAMTGTQGGWDAHMIEHELSASTDLNHGHGMAIVYIGWMRYVMENLSGKLAGFAEKVFGIERGSKTDIDLAGEGIDKLVAFWQELGIELCLTKAGVEKESFSKIAKQSVRFGPLGLIKQLNEEDVVNILESVGQEEK